MTERDAAENSWDDIANDIFLDAAEMSDDKARARFLHSRCGQDESLKQKVDSLLAASEKLDGFLNRPACSFDVDQQTAMHVAVHLAEGESIGRYKLLQEIGEGGFGVVYMAEQKRPVRRKVALKIIKPGMDTREVIARFEVERQALAMMDHPNIAKVLDAGTTDAGRPFFVMELVKGVPITEFCDENLLTTSQRLGLFITVCRAVQHAHQKGVIHRDLKPSNIMVTLKDGDPMPKVIDFGVAKAINHDLTDKTLFTRYGQMVGTPQYMSPEQAAISETDLDTRSDIYSLGVLLYELLTGSPPLEAARLRESAFAEIQRMIRELDAPKPSTRISSLGNELKLIADRRNVDPARLHRDVAGDLDWIVLKSLEKDRNRRYETVTGFAADIQRHLADEPVIARPPSRTYRLRKLFRRNKLIFGSVAAVASAVVIGFAAAIWGLTAAVNQQGIAESRLAESIEANKTAQRERDNAVREKSKAYRNSYVADTGAAHRAIQEGNLGRARSLLAEYDRASEDIRGFEWWYLWRQAKGDHEAALGKYDGTRGGLAISPDGRTLACLRKQKIDIVDLSTGEVQRTLPIDRPVGPLKFSQDGAYLVAQSPPYASHPPPSDSEPRTVARVLRWDARTGEQITPLPISFPLVFPPDGQTVVAWDGAHFSIWNLETSERVTQLPATTPFADYRRREWTHPTDSIALSPDGRRLYYLGLGSGVRCRIHCYDFEIGANISVMPVERPHGGVMCLATSNEALAIGTYNGSILLFDLDTSSLQAKEQPHLAWIGGLAFIEGGSKLISSSSDRTIGVHDSTTGKIVRRLLGHDREIWELEVADDETTIVSGSARDGMILRWLADKSTTPDAKPIGERILAPLQGEQVLCYRPDSPGLVVIHTGTGNVTRAGMQQLEERFSAADFSSLITVSPDLRWAVGLDESGRLGLYDAKTGGCERELSHDFGQSTWAWFSQDGTYLVTAGQDSEVRLWNTASWSWERLMEPIPGKCRGVNFSPDLTHLIVTVSREEFVVIDIASKSEVFRNSENNPVTYATMSRDGRYLAAAYFDNIVRLWNLENNDPDCVELHGHVAGVFAVAFSPDGRTLASSSDDKRIKLWNTETHREIFTIYSDDEYAMSYLRFSPDGLRLAAYALSDRTGGWRFKGSHIYRIWDASLRHSVEER